MPYYWVMVCEVSTQRKVHPRTGHKGPEEESKYNSTLSLTLALDRGGWLMSRPGCVTPRNDPLYRRLGGAQCRSRIPTGITSLDRPTCSKSLYQLYHPGPWSTMQHNVFISNCCNAQEEIFTKS